MLHEQAARVSTAEVYRKHGISSATSYAWKATDRQSIDDRPRGCSFTTRGTRSFLDFRGPDSRVRTSTAALASDEEFVSPSPHFSNIEVHRGSESGKSCFATTT